MEEYSAQIYSNDKSNSTNNQLEVNGMELFLARLNQLKISYKYRFLKLPNSVWEEICKEYLAALDEMKDLRSFRD